MVTFVTRDFKHRERQRQQRRERPPGKPNSPNVHVWRENTLEQPSRCDVKKANSPLCQNVSIKIPFSVAFLICTVPCKCKLTVPRSSNFETRSSILEAFEYRCSSRVHRVSSRVLRVSRQETKNFSHD